MSPDRTRNVQVDVVGGSPTAHSASMIQIGDTFAPTSPSHLPETGIDPDVLADLALRFAFSLSYFTTERAAESLCLATPMVGELLKRLLDDKLIENLGASGPLDYRYTITDAGRERARRLLEVSGYSGPAPVSIESYTSLLEWQMSRFPEVTPDEVAAAIDELVLEVEAVQVAGLAGSADRSLFLYGPPGNGKTSLGHLLHKAVKGDLWIPYCIGVDSSVIRVFDPLFHVPDPLPNPPEELHGIDKRWIRIKRPFIVAGGEMTIESMDLAYSPGLRYYEAPLHMKANGGTFLLDDLGFQQENPQELLARWIFPLEHQVDFLTLKTGQKIQVPFRQKLIVSTNMDPERMMNPAFLRRMGYRLYLGDPTPGIYTEIFNRYAAGVSTAVPPDMVNGLLKRYQEEGRSLRSCEPRDLIERVRDYCRFQDLSLELTQENIDLAWRGYFGKNIGTGKV